MPIAFEASPEISIFIIAPERPLCGKRTIHNLIFENGTRFISGARCLKKYLASFLRKTDRICCWSQTAAVGSGTRSTERSARQVHLPCPSSEAAGGPPVPKARLGGVHRLTRKKRAAYPYGYAALLCAKAHRGDRFRPVRVSYGISSGARSYPAARGVSSPGPPAGDSTRASAS